jgi:hypothetical protein
LTQYDTYYDVYTYLNRLIYFKIDNYNNWKHREISLRFDPLLNTYITKLDNEIFSELPIFEPDILGVEQDKEKRQMNGRGVRLLDEPDSNPSPIKQEWQEENWSDLWRRIFDMCRIHRWCIVKLYEEEPYWRVFGPRETYKINWGDDGKPNWADVKWFKRLPRSQNVAYQFEDRVEFGDDKPSLLIKFGKPEGRYVASDDLEHIWDLLIALRYIQKDIVRNSARSSGFYFIKLGRMASENDKDDIEEALSKASYGNAIASKETKIEEIMDVHPENAEFSIKAYDKLIKKFAGACRLPLSFFNAESEKSGIGVESKESEDILVNKKKRYIFGQFKTYMLKLIEKRWGIICDDVYPNIEEYEEETYKEDIVNTNKSKEEEIQNVR